jgi:hypothetical protein
MAGLRQQRCHNHAGREAIARCPSCGNFFCRECITEHDDRILCAACLKRQTAPQEHRRRVLPIGRLCAALIGVVAAWFYFYVIARVLVATPTQFHEATLWKSVVEDELQKEEQP